MAKSLRDLSLDAFKKDPLYGLLQDCWRPVQWNCDDLKLIQKPEPLNSFVDSLLGTVQIGWRLEGKVIGCSYLLNGFYKVERTSPGLVACAIIDHYRKIQLWNSVFNNYNHYQYISRFRQ